MSDFGFSLITIAQDVQSQTPAQSPAQPPAPGESAGPAAPSTGGTLAPSTVTPGGNGAPLGGSAQQAPGNPMFLILIAAVGLMLLFSIMGQRRDRKKREALMSAIKKHDRVLTTGGIIGSVVEIKPDQVVLKVDESSNTRITFARSAVAQVLSVSSEAVSGGGAGTGVSEKAA